jgi:hypothetical protein
VPTEGFEWYVRKKRAIFSFLTNDNLFAIFIGWPVDKFDSVKADIEGQFMQVVDLIPEFSGRVRSGRREGRFYGTADLPNFLRRPFGPGWALVGDAACHKDPLMGLGICDAFRDADFLACAVHEGLAGERPLNEALKVYNMLTAMTVIVQVPDDKRSSEQRQKIERFTEIGCTSCHQVTPGKLGLTEVGTKPQHLHLGCVDVEMAVASSTSSQH